MVNGSDVAIIGQRHTNRRGYWYQIGKWILRFRWYLIFGLGLVVLLFEGFELLEFTDGPPFSDPHVRVELLLYLLVIIIVALLAEIYVRLLRMHSQALDLLKLKHVLSQDLTKTNDWDEVCQKVCQELGEFGAFDEVLLSTYEKDSATYQVAASWRAGWLKRSFFQDLSPIQTQDCCDQDTEHTYNLKLCACSVDLSASYKVDVYCIPIHDHNVQVARLYFSLPSGVMLTKEVSDLLENIEDDIAIALTTTRLKQKQEEMKIAKSTAELKGVISQDLHDTIGQNLGYLRLKLDQFSRAEFHGDLAVVRPELESLRDLANASYEMVRDLLVAINPDPSMQLEKLLEYHAKLISDRTGICIEFLNHGQSRSLNPITIHHIYFIFREALNNIERHAQAQKVAVNMFWIDAGLQIKIMDNGKGFDPDQEPELGHYGLKIMSERASSLGGRLDLLSSADEGTHISLWIPLVA